MPAKNIYHDTVIQALTADGWTITDDPPSFRMAVAIFLLIWARSV